MVEWRGWRVFGFKDRFEARFGAKRLSSVSQTPWKKSQYDSASGRHAVVGVHSAEDYVDVTDWLFLRLRLLLLVGYTSEDGKNWSSRLC